MTISPCRSRFFVDYKDLHQLLLAVQEKCCENHTQQIVSISLEIDLIDPLIVLDKFAQANTLNFYFENKSKGEAITAIDSITKLKISGADRFNQAEDFIKNCRKNIISFGNIFQGFAGSHFFCSFSFFDQHNQVNYPFPSATIFLPKLQVAVKNESCVLVMNSVINADINIQTILQELKTKIQSLQSLTKPNIEIIPAKFIKENIINSDNFKYSVLSALEKIKSNHLIKIVLADALDVKSYRPFNLFKSLNNLRQLHPNCYVFSTSNGKGQNFIGASPERLISIQNQQLITDALAGSAPRGKTPREDAENANRLINSTKEKHEHKLVLDFITQRLSQLGLFPQILSPRLRQLSNIQHLWTPISAVVPANVHPLKIVGQLHPTPAVAGAARDVACAEIRNYESFERGLYAAPLGWVDSSGNCEFIVGIRSALIDGDRARLYAGAGIVAGSDPDKEFAEVQLKLQALLKALV
ncbi:isochorismate synthase [Anabaena cylindrica FACHB-243]|uniref:isochorismate synthase n=1 Tax=Anabaena cylindrica (strain ATCC 27899 / PCC 7122) TaxID=272123 RepID=K9ZN84_ANACC|nr:MULTISPECIES: isochorismate synthase [Anabaena]AFZ59775.1 isochorismate synthase [Anabaena cylindrica PCC 7122]MBD2417178.1 isochorismate synthase [Anabaena cylindrica FACHB-243]MBY5282262.1 isochorismate synthase [Anabaena sp. CCAP 1446/1C]MBY5309407.1 isochorismate synthase [Anabaena sp. CCAP 1446/1C]MCM2405006.1 isochorismate synthase [Anabaena sp. CCAP 1446/1C]